MNCVLVALTDNDGGKDISKVLAVARDLAEPSGAEVRVLQVVEDSPDSSLARTAVGMEAARIPEMGDIRIKSQVSLTDDACECIETHLRRLSPLALVLSRDRFRWGGRWWRRGGFSTSEYVARRFGIPVVTPYAEVENARAL